MKDSNKRAKRPAETTTPGPRSIYLGKLYEDIHKEAERQGRSVSWIVRAAFHLALPELKKMAPAVKA